MPADAASENGEGRQQHRRLRDLLRPVDAGGSWLRLLLAVVVVAVSCALLAVLAERGQLAARAWFAQAPVLALLAIPMAFAALVGIARATCPGALGGGIAQTLAAMTLPPAAAAALLSLRVAIGKVLLTAAALSAGASLGREGPGVQIGAAWFQHVGIGRRPLSTTATRQWWAIGAAAGVAATFGTPLAGLVFALEQLRQRWRPQLLMVAVIAVVLAAALARALRVDGGVIAPIAPTSLPLDAWLAVVICGVCGGLLGGGFARGLLAATHHGGPWLRRWPLACAAALGLVVALLALATDGASLGSGLFEIDRWLREQAGPASGHTLAKWAATLASALSTVPGGLVSPSLAIGASLGAELAPWLTMTPFTALVVLGMTAVQAAISRAPLTAAVLVVELLSAYALLPPVLAVALLAAWVSKQLSPISVFDGLARALGAPPPLRR